MNNKYILLLMFLLYQAKTFGQSDNTLLQTEVTVNYSGTSLYIILNEIQEKYKINFYYSNNLIPLDHTVSIVVKKHPLSKVLDLIFKGTPIRYKVIGDQIVLIKEIKEEAKVTESKPLSNPVIKKDTLSGKIIRKEKESSATFHFKNGNMKNIREWRRSQRGFKTNISHKSTKDSTQIKPDTLSEEEKNFISNKHSLKKAFRLKTIGTDNFTLDFNLTSGSSFRKLTFNNKEGEEITKKRKDERNKIAFITEIQCTYLFTSYFSVSGGFGYMNLGEKGSYKDSSTYSNKFGYLTIPLAASYHFHFKKLSFKTGLGLIPSFLISNGSNELQYSKLGKVPKDSITNRDFNIAYALYIESGYRIKKMTITAGLAYRHFFYSTYKSAALKEINFLTGIYVGLKYHF